MYGQDGTLRFTSTGTALGNSHRLDRYKVLLVFFFFEVLVVVKDVFSIFFSIKVLCGRLEQAWQKTEETKPSELEITVLDAEYCTP